jgi:outer membrane protein assembly factor BamB
MSGKRISIWIVAIAASLCVLSVTLVWILLFTFPILSTSFGLGTHRRGIEYPSELLDRNEDGLADLNVTGLPLSPVWEYQAPGPISRPPLFYASHIILKGDKAIWSVNASSGDEEWSYESNYRIAPPYTDNVGVSDGIVLFQTYPWPSRLYAIDLETGHDLWETQSVVRGLASDDESQLFIASTDSFQALDAANGQANWVSDVRPSERGASNLLYDLSARELYGWNDDGILVVLDKENGRLRRELSEFSEELLNGAGSVKIANDGILYVEKLYPASLIAMDSLERRTLWTKNCSPRNPMFQPLMYEDSLFIKTSQGSLLAVNRQAGDILWQFPHNIGSSTSPELLSNLVILDGIVYGIFSDARLRGFDASTGQEIGHIQFVDVANVPYTNLTVPGLAASDNMLFVSLGKTKLYAFVVIP